LCVYFPQKSPTITGSFAERDMQLMASYETHALRNVQGDLTNDQCVSVSVSVSVSAFVPASASVCVCVCVFVSVSMCACVKRGGDSL